MRLSEIDPGRLKLIAASGSAAAMRAALINVSNALVADRFEVELERCQFCGVMVETACDDPPPDICEKAISGAAQP